MIPALTPPASIGSAWFRRGTLDVNQVIGDTTAVRLNVMGEKTHDAGRDKVKNERYGVAPSIAFGLGTANRLYLNICMSPSTTRQTAAFRPSVCRVILPICGNSGSESFRKS
ncbi:catecholate siderophore TonB-dependent receptor [Escherichia coli]|uniref:Catecholate siderophore TonB-dependent receptor n=1 Tax=Escherichia coli TaxID=562 RepID=A0A376UCS3_ECOLX|nr:catecholate siderophore TonB-dependent receptor [Escherichia coli]